LVFWFSFAIVMTSVFDMLIFMWLCLLILLSLLCGPVNRLCFHV
jgi:hypothetical protein